jgi:hypothetical protein
VKGEGGKGEGRGGEGEGREGGEEGEGGEGGGLPFKNYAEMWRGQCPYCDRMCVCS